MVYQRRGRSEIDLYHVVARGAGKQVIFEDDDDRAEYLKLVEALLQSWPVEVLAWCLMDNHVHFLFRGNLDAIGSIMRDLGRSYARYFNDKHQRVGHLFQGRYRSIPIASEEQALVVARYIHQNHWKAGKAGSCDVRWSSYRSYLGGPDQPRITNIDPILSCFEGIEAFKQFNEELDAADAVPHRLGGVFRFSDDEARRVLDEELSREGVNVFPIDEKTRRNRLLSRLKSRGLTIRQLERLTGVGRGIIARA